MDGRTVGRFIAKSIGNWADGWPKVNGWTDRQIDRVSSEAETYQNWTHGRSKVNGLYERKHNVWSRQIDRWSDGMDNGE